MQCRCIEHTKQIGIITPYNAQVSFLKKELEEYNQIKIGTVEEFQGDEKKIILMSCVKTFGKHFSLNFVLSPHRMNTAISRAK